MKRSLFTENIFSAVFHNFLMWKHLFYELRFRKNSPFALRARIMVFYLMSVVCFVVIKIIEIFFRVNYCAYNSDEHRESENTQREWNDIEIFDDFRHEDDCWIQMLLPLHSNKSLGGTWVGMRM